MRQHCLISAVTGSAGRAARRRMTHLPLSAQGCRPVLGPTHEIGDRAWVRVSECRGHAGAEVRARCVRREPSPEVYRAAMRRCSQPDLASSPADRALFMMSCSVAAVVGPAQRALCSVAKGMLLTATHAMTTDPAVERRALLASQPCSRPVSAQESAVAIAGPVTPPAASTTLTVAPVGGGTAQPRLRAPDA